MYTQGESVKKYSLLLLVVSSLSITAKEYQTQAERVLEKYKSFLDRGTYEGFEEGAVRPQSRYYTFAKAFKHFEENNGMVVVELGTTRSFVHGGLPGCNSDNPMYWTPNNPENWDWGAGSFTRMAAECLMHLHPAIYTVDLEAAHINRCKIITKPFENNMRYRVCSSLDFLKTCQFPTGIDLLYLDTGDITPIEPTARLQLAEVRIIVERNLIAPNGLILIDDVAHPTPKRFGETSHLGKAKYSIPYLLANGFEVVENEFQVILRKTKTNKQ
jgi:hypothetical protein